MVSEMLLEVGTHVRLVSGHRLGVVVGYAGYDKDGLTLLLHLVSLEVGFWSADGDVYVNLLPMSEKSLEVVEE